MLSIPWKKPFVLQWTLKDGSGQPINNASVTATLYGGRSRLHPDRVPGTQLGPINSLSLSYVAQSAGVYQASVAASDTPNPATPSYYTIVFDSSIGAVAIDHSEEPTTVFVES